MLYLCNHESKVLYSHVYFMAYIGSLSILDILMDIPKDGYLVDVHKAVATYVLERKGHM